MKTPKQAFNEAVEVTRKKIRERDIIKEVEEKIARRQMYKDFGLEVVGE